MPTALRVSPSMTARAVVGRFPMLLRRHLGHYLGDELQWRLIQDLGYLWSKLRRHLTSSQRPFKLIRRELAGVTDVYAYHGHP